MTHFRSVMYKICRRGCLKRETELRRFFFYGPVLVLMMACWGAASGPNISDAKPVRNYTSPYGKCNKLDNGRSAQLSQIGPASWYGRRFHGKLTANGERYDMHDMTAAHATIAMGTYVRVTNLDNGRAVVVRINDRGPFISGRVMDLSYAAALALQMGRKGLQNIRIDPMESRSVATSYGNPAVGTARDFVHE